MPYTRGRERSRPVKSIIKEIEVLEKKNFSEITLLGQNVNSYNFSYGNEKYDFPALLDYIAKSFPNLRIRFATSHPKDLSENLVKVMANHNNICKSIHLPVQSGSDIVLKRMNRKYTVADYL